MDEIRIERASDAKELLRLAGSVGWNQTLNDCAELVDRPDAVCFFALKDNAVIGSAAAKLYGKKEMGYINMVVVMEEFRGHGIATRMLRTLMEYLRDFKTLRLYATDAGSYVYSKLGFETYATMHKYGADRYRAQVSDRIRPMLESDLPQAVAMDAASFGLNRESTLAYFYRQAPEFSFKLCRKDGSLSGFTIGRNGPVSRMASAITADSEEDALTLFDAVAMAAPPAEKSLMVIPDNQTRMIELGKRHGFTMGTALVCMDYGHPGPMPASNYFGMLGGDFG